MDLDDTTPQKGEATPASEASMTIIKAQDFEEQDFSKQLDPENDWESEHPIFMTKLPEEMNSQLMALQDLKYGGASPEDVADRCKEQGNEFFKKGPKYYKYAVEWYTKALAEKVNDPIRTSVYYSNRAMVNLEMGNYARTIEDSEKAIEFNKDNVKAYFRAAKASAQLDKYETALRYIELAFKIEPGNAGLAKERTEIEKMWSRHKARVEAAAARQRRLEAERDAVMRQKGAWVKMLHDRNVAIGPYLFSTMDEYLNSGAKPYLDDKTNLMHWPVLFLYDEYRQLDFIQDFSEEHTFGDHLKVMFPGDSFCEWDSDKKYIYSNLEVFFVVNQSPAFMKKASSSSTTDLRPRKIKVNHTTKLKKVLEHPEYVVPGYPVFYIVVAGSKFKEDFLKRSFNLGE